MESHPRVPVSLRSTRQLVIIDYFAALATNATLWLLLYASRPSRTPKRAVFLMKAAFLCAF